MQEERHGRAREGEGAEPKLGGELRDRANDSRRLRRVERPGGGHGHTVRRGAEEDTVPAETQEDESARAEQREEHGFEAIKRQVFQNIMGGMFSARDLEVQGAAIHVSGNTGWSEFHWVFHATMRKDGSAVTTHGVETQVYRRESGKWRLVHVHYSEDRQSVP